jgi:F-type H+-transporting ATPase subunit b
MKRPSLRVRGLGALAAVILTLGLWRATADAQPEQPAPPEQPKAPVAPPEAPKAPKAPGEAPKVEAPRAPDVEQPKADEPRRPPPDQQIEGLPPGHPPIGPGGPPKPRTPLTREQLEELMKRRREAAGGPSPIDLPPVVPAKPRHPRDEHGSCIGDGADDPPKEINLLHGWLGVNNEKAVKAPPRFGGEDWWGQNDLFNLGNKAWWAWRLTPHPWRYENHSDHCDPQNQPLPLASNIVNVGVLLFILVRFGRRPMSEALARRKRGIMSEIDKAQGIKKSAKKRLDRYEDELEHLDERLVALRDQYLLEGEHEERRVREEATKTRERLLADAEFRISQEHKTARDELSRRALEDALSAAEEMLERAVTSADHDRLEAEYLDQLDAALRDREKAAPEKGGAS